MTLCSNRARDVLLYSQTPKHTEHSLNTRTEVRRISGVTLKVPGVLMNPGSRHRIPGVRWLT